MKPMRLHHPIVVYTPAGMKVLPHLPFAEDIPL